MNFDKDTLFPFLNNKNIPEFYKNIVKAWHVSHVICHPPNNIMDIKNEIIWGNRYILKAKTTTLFMKQWIDSGVIYIGDICNVKGFLQLDVLKTKIKAPNANLLHEFKIIVDSLPKHWRNCIKESNNCNWKKELNILKWNEEIYTQQNLHAINCKLVYSFLVQQKVIQPTESRGKTYWGLYFNLDKDYGWHLVWINQTIQLSNNLKLAEFNFKLLHNILRVVNF